MFSHSRHGLRQGMAIKQGLAVPEAGVCAGDLQSLLIDSRVVTLRDYSK